MARSINVYAASVGAQFGQSAENFGDNLMKDLLEGLFGLQVTYVKYSRAELLGVGSILDSYHRRKRRDTVPLLSHRPWRKLHVWGSGFMDTESQPLWPQRLEFSAVRGPLTAQRIDRDDVAQGDPALLLPLIFPARRTPRFEVGIIPHFATMTAFWEKYANDLPKNWRIIDLLQKPCEIAKTISACDAVISSSLHGIIVADAYNIPSIWMSPDSPIKGDGFKFRDYAAQRGLALRDPIEFKQVLDTKIMDEAWTVAPPNRDCLDRLITSFPFA